MRNIRLLIGYGCNGSPRELVTYRAAKRRKNQKNPKKGINSAQKEEGEMIKALKVFLCSGLNGQRNCSWGAISRLTRARAYL